MAEFKIEKNIPFPRSGSMYPIAEMEVGDSFLVEDIDKRSSVVTTICRFRKEQPDRKFTTRKVEDGYRCWRTK